MSVVQDKKGIEWMEMSCFSLCKGNEGKNRINTKPEKRIKEEKKIGRWLIFVVERNMFKVWGGRNNQG